MADEAKTKSTSTNKADTKKADEAVDLTSPKTQTDLPNDVHADRVSDLSPTPTDVDANRDKLNPKLGEELAEEAVEKRSATGGNVELVENDGVVSAVSSPVVDRSDNGKVYRDERVNPRDTNAPDAGLTPDGRRIAE